MENNTVSLTTETPASSESSPIEKMSIRTEGQFRKMSDKWTIKNFTFLANHNYWPNWKTSRDNWDISLHKWGHYGDEFLEMRLAPPQSNKNDIYAKYKLIIYDCMEKEFYVECSPHHFKSTKIDRIAKVLCSLKKIYFSTDPQILSNDALTVGWEIEYVTDIKTIKTNCDSEFMNSKPHCFNTLEHMFNNPKFSDVKINIKGRMFEAHKAILAVASPVFSAMFESNMIEAKQNCINIDDIDEETFNEMLRFMYCGNVNNIENMADTLLAAADKYAINELKNVCENELCKSLTADNVFKVLILADRHSAVELKKKIINFIKFEQVDVTKTEEFN